MKQPMDRSFILNVTPLLAAGLPRSGSRFPVLGRRRLFAGKRGGHLS